MTPTLWGVSSGAYPVVLGKAVGNLTKSVGISIRVGLTLAVVVASVASVGDLTEGVGISISLGLGLRVSLGLTLAVEVSSVASVANVSVSTVVSTVSDSTEARHTSVSMVHSSDNPDVVGVASGIGVSLGKTVSDLAEGVGISLRISVGGNNGQENNGKGLHLSCVQAN